MYSLPPGQWNSDVNSVYENVTAGEVYPRELLSEHCPADKKHDVDYIMSLMDWEKNIDPYYKKNFSRPPIPCSMRTRVSRARTRSMAAGRSSKLVIRSTP